jgi:hypothetical protein
MVFRICSVVSIVTGLLILPAWAGRPRRPQQPKKQDVTVTGSFGKIEAGGFSMVADAKGGGKTWVVYTGPATTYHATGTAVADFLRAKLVVQFAADVDESGESKDKVGELTIVSPTPEHVFGVFQGEGAKANPATPPPAKPAAKKDKDKAAAPAGPSGFDNSSKAKVVGRVTSFKENHLVVAAGKRKIQVDLTEEPVIHVDVAEASFATSGDKVVVHGKDVKGKPGTCEAGRVEITFSQPLTNAKKKLALAKTETHHSHKSAGDDELKDDASTDAATADTSKDDAAKKDDTKGDAKKDAPAKEEKAADADAKAK